MRPVTASRLTWWKFLLVIGIGLLAAACGSSGTGSGSAAPTGKASSPAATSTASAVCQHAAALRTSVSKLTEVHVNSGTADEIKADLQAVKSDLSALTAGAGSQWHTQTSALKSALNETQSAVASLTSQPSAETVKNTAHALGNVKTETQNLLTAVHTDCPSVSPSISSSGSM